MSLKETQRLNRRERRKRGIRRASGALLVAGLLLGTGSAFGTSMLTAAPASAVSLGAGVWFGGDTGAGNFLHADGYIVYCAELGKATVMGNNPALGATSALPAYSVGSYMVNGQTFTGISAPELSGDMLKYYNYVLSHYGATADNHQAAAVQIALWQLRSGGASAGYQQALAYMQAGVGPDVVAFANAMIAEAMNAGAAIGAPSDPRITHTGPYAGYVTADPGTTELTIENAIFTQTGTNRIEFPGGTTGVLDIPFVGQAPYDDAGWDRYYTITVTGKYQYTVESSEVYYGTPGGLGQGLVAGGGVTPVSGDYSAVYIDPDTIWSPSLTTETPSKFVQEGESFSDTVTFDVADGSNPWRIGVRDGATIFAPITAKGTLYGPFLSDPADNPSAEPPKNAPIAATAEITTDTVTGPGTYAPTVEGVSKEAGYYSWVWSIEYDEQLSSITNPPGGHPSLPENYYFTDGFGKVSEGQITPSDISFTTQLSTDSVTIGGTFTDDVSVYLNKGGWLQTDGGRTPFTLRGTVYTLDEKPEQQATAPADAEVLTTTMMNIDSPDETFTSEAVQIPYTSDDKYVTVQWCLLDEDQAENAVGKAKEYCDDFGVPSETAEITRPEVSTQAQPDGAYKGDIHDTALVEGSIVDNAKNEIDFTYYLQPKAGEPKYDSNWEKVLDEAGEPVLWTEEELTDPAAVCLAQPVATTDRVEVTQTGNVDSPAVLANSVGTGYWVERYYVTPPEGEEVLIHEGKCGIENEKTVVDYPKVRTEAQSSVVVGDDIWDTAIVEGPISERVEYEVTFKAYEREGDKLVCSPETEIKDFEDATGVKVDKPGRYESKKVTTTEKHVGLGGYVETLWLIEDGEKTAVHVGKCGEPSENFEVKEKPFIPVPPVIEKLATTGGPSLAMFGLAGAALLAGGAAATVYAMRRRKLAGPESVDVDEA